MMMIISWYRRCYSYVQRDILGLGICSGIYSDPEMRLFELWIESNEIRRLDGYNVVLEAFCFPLRRC